MMYITQIIMLYPLKYGAVCHFYLNKTGRRNSNHLYKSAPARHWLSPPVGYIV